MVNILGVGICLLGNLMCSYAVILASWMNTDHIINEDGTHGGVRMKYIVVSIILVPCTTVVNVISMSYISATLYTILTYGCSLPFDVILQYIHLSKKVTWELVTSIFFICLSASFTAMYAPGQEQVDVLLEFQSLFFTTWNLIAFVVYQLMYIVMGYIVFSIEVEEEGHVEPVSLENVTAGLFVILTSTNTMIAFTLLAGPLVNLKFIFI